MPYLFLSTMSGCQDEPLCRWSILMDLNSSSVSQALRGSVHSCRNGIAQRAVSDAKLHKKRGPNSSHDRRDHNALTILTHALTTMVEYIST